MTWEMLAPWIAIAFTLALSILVPLFTQIANNNHQRKMQREKLMVEQSKKRIEAYESFLLSVGGIVTSSHYAAIEWINKAGSDLHRIYIYAPKDWWGDLDELTNCIEDHQWEKARKIMQKLSHLVSNELKM